MRTLKEPLLHFFVLGLAVFGLYALFEERPEDVPDPYLVEVTSADIEWFRTMWRKRRGREPNVDEMRGLVNQFIREQVLGREAIRLGLDQDDPVLRQRLSQKMDYLIRDLSDLREPTDEDLAAFLLGHPEEYENPARVTFTQIFVNADERGHAAAADLVEKLISDLSGWSDPPSDVSELGDPILLESHFAEVPDPEVRLSFGEEFADSLASLPPGTWQGPLRSGYGLHAVYVQEILEPHSPDFLEVRDRLRNDWMFAQQKELSSRAYQELRGQYQVLLEGLPYAQDLEQ